MQLIYMDSAATGFPKPEAVYRTMDSFYRQWGGNPGRGGHIYSRRAHAAVEKTRAKLAEFFHADTPQQVVFTLNATDSLNMALQGVLHAGDEVITTVLEHNSILRPLAHLQHQGIISVKHLKPEGEIVSPQRIREALSPRTRMVVMTHASNVTGWIQPVTEIGQMLKDTGILLTVDAAQTAGVLPIHVKEMGIHLLAFTGHKGMQAPMGIGGLIVDPSVPIRPLRTGGSGTASESQFQPEEMPYRLEAGTLNLPAIVGLEQGLDFILSEGMDNIRRKEQEIHAQFMKELDKIPELELFTSRRPDGGMSIISFRLSRLSPENTASILDSEFGIACRAGLHCAPLIHQHLGTFPEGTVRLSPGYFTTGEEIEKTVQAVAEIARSTK